MERHQNTKSPAFFLILLLACLALNALINAYFFASMPLLGRQFGFSDLQTGILLGIGSVGLIFISPFWGYRSDIWGRRPILRISLWGIGLISPCLALLLSALSSDMISAPIGFLAILAIKACQTVMTAGLMPIAQACLADITPPPYRRQRMAFLGAAYGIGSVLGGSLLWGISQDHTVTTGYWVVTALACPLLAMAYPLLGETRPAIPADNSPPFPASTNSILPKWRMLWPFLIITFLTIIIFSALKQVTGLQLQDHYGMTSQQALAKTGMILMFSAIIMIFAQIIVNQLVKAGAWHFIFTGAVMSVIGLSLLWQTVPYPFFIAALLLISFALGLILPANLALLSGGNPPNIQGKIAGLNASCQGCAMVISPIITPSIAAISPNLPFLLFACLSGWIAFYALMQIFRKVTDHES